MGDTSTPALDPAILRNNMAALHQADPALAQQLDGLDGPHVAVVRTRDGQPSFRIAQADGTSTWYGRSSVPLVRAQALLDKFDPGLANVLLPGAAAGFEARLLLERLGRHRAVFIWEQELSCVQLLLRLHDVAKDILDQRLVFLVCPLGELTARLLAWLESHPGHLCPDRLMMWPWQTPAEIAPCRSAVEAAYQQIESRRQRALGAIHDTWRTAPVQARGREARPGPDSSVALLALHANEDTLALVDALAGAVAAGGGQAIKIDVRSPADMHPLARAGRWPAAAQSWPSWAILVDVTRQQVRDVLPSSIPAVSWLGPRATLGADLARQIGHDALVVTSPALAQQAQKRASAPGRISVCPPPCLAPLDADRPPERTDRPIAVLLAADTGAVDAASVGLSLPAYAQIWTMAVDLLAAQIESFQPSEAAALLERAEKKVRAKIDDPNLRAEMLTALGGKVTSFILARHLAEVLSADGITFRILGSGWTSPWADRVLATGGPQRRAEVMSRAKLVIQADTTGEQIGEALLAAGCGAVLLAWAGAARSQSGGLRELLKPREEMLFFSTGGELVGHVRRLLGKEEERLAIGGRAWRRCLDEHSPGCRLEKLRAAVTSYATIG